jgi:hypothetical protein
MTPSDLASRLPLIRGWIDDLLARSRPLARRVASLGLPRLPDFYSADTLSGAYVVEVDDVPVPPLGALGLPDFAEFESMEAEGITFQDHYFVKRGRAHDEALHFHELVHIVQWRLLGPEQFLLSYAAGYVTHGGYASNPFEQIAFDLQDRFESGEAPFSVEPVVRQHLEQVLSRHPQNR